MIDSVKHTDIGQYRCTGQFKADISTDEATLTIGASKNARSKAILNEML